MHPFLLPASSFAGDPFSAQHLPVAQPKPELLTGLQVQLHIQFDRVQSQSFRRILWQRKKAKWTLRSCCLFVSTKLMPIFICPSESED